VSTAVDWLAPSIARLDSLYGPLHPHPALTITSMGYTALAVDSANGDSRIFARLMFSVGGRLVVDAYGASDGTRPAIGHGRRIRITATAAQVALDELARWLGYPTDPTLFGDDT
jgi:hypothetical protein